MIPSKYKPVTSEIIEELRRICGEEFVYAGDEKKLAKYSRDKVPEDYGHMPEVVVLPNTAREIADILKLANREMIPITPRAAGSGLSGGAVPIYGGILLSVERMDEIIEIDDQNLMAVVEPGVITNKLDEALRDYGLFFAGYPMSEEFCFIGGNVAENAGGGKAVKYGVTGQYIQGLEIVTPTGDIIELGGKRIKDVTGYNLVQLMVGSEGTLGIYTRMIPCHLLCRDPFSSSLFQPKWLNTMNSSAPFQVPQTSLRSVWSLWSVTPCCASSLILSSL